MIFLLLLFAVRVKSDDNEEINSSQEISIQYGLTVFEQNEFVILSQKLEHCPPNSMYVDKHNETFHRCHCPDNEPVVSPEESYEFINGEAIMKNAIKYFGIVSCTAPKWDVHSTDGEGVITNQKRNVQPLIQAEEECDAFVEQKNNETGRTKFLHCMRGFFRVDKTGVPTYNCDFGTNKNAQLFVQNDETNGTLSNPLALSDGKPYVLKFTNGEAFINKDSHKISDDLTTSFLEKNGRIFMTSFMNGEKQTAFNQTVIGLYCVFVSGKRNLRNADYQPITFPEPLLPYTKFDENRIPKLHAKNCDMCPVNHESCKVVSDDRVSCECPPNKLALSNASAIDEHGTIYDWDVKKDYALKCIAPQWKMFKVDPGLGIDWLAKAKPITGSPLLKHKYYQCLIFARERNALNKTHEIECVKGSFVLLQREPAYSCPFAGEIGRVMVSAEGTLPSISLPINHTQHTDEYLFTLLSLPVLEKRHPLFFYKTADFETDIRSSIVADKNGVPKISKEDYATTVQIHPVTGFACIIERQRPEEIKTETIEYKRVDIFEADSCRHCFQGQLCTPISNNIFNCSCPDHALEIYPNTDLHSQQGEPACRNNYDMSFVPDAQRWLPVVSSPMDCELYIREVMEYPYSHILTCVSGKIIDTDDGIPHFSCPFAGKQGHVFVKVNGTEDALTDLYDWRGRTDDFVFTFTNLSSLNERHQHCFVWHHSKPPKRICTSFVASQDLTRFRVNSPKSKQFVYDVIGFHCVTWKRFQFEGKFKSVAAADRRKFYPKHVPADLRPASRHDVFNVTDCAQCFPGQNCVWKENINMFECSCPYNQLSLYKFQFFHGAAPAQCQNTYYKSYDYNNIGKIVKAEMNGQPLTHVTDVCNFQSKFLNMLTNFQYPGFNKSLSCFDGEFSRHPEYQGVYTCDFKNQTGFLFMRLVKENGDNCAFSTTMKAKGLFSFIPGFEEAERHPSKQPTTQPDYYAYRGRLYDRYNGCIVQGLSCMLDTETASPATNPPPPTD